MNEKVAEAVKSYKAKRKWLDEAMGELAVQLWLEHRGKEQATVNSLYEFVRSRPIREYLRKECGFSGWWPREAIETAHAKLLPLT